MFVRLRRTAAKVPVGVVVSPLPAACPSATTTASISRSRAYGTDNLQPDALLCSVFAVLSLHAAEQRFRPGLLNVSCTVLDGTPATVPNARWRKVICDSQETESPETKQPA